MDTSDYHQHLVLQSLAFKAVMMSLSYEHNLPDLYRTYSWAILWRMLRDWVYYFLSLHSSLLWYVAAIINF
jgi:hypothetical protein